MPLFVLKSLIILGTPEHAFIYFEKFNNNRHARTCLQSKNKLAINDIYIYIKTSKMGYYRNVCQVFCMRFRLICLSISI